MAASQAKSRLSDDWEVHTFQIGVPLGDCAIHLLVKNAVRYTEGQEFKVVDPKESKNDNPKVPIIKQPTFRRIVQLTERDLPIRTNQKKGSRRRGPGQGEVHAALIFDGGHDDDGPGYHGKQSRAAIERAISHIESQYTFKHVADDVEATPKRDGKTSLNSQLIFNAWVVTHWDRDHYCGSLTMFRDDIFQRWKKKKSKLDSEQVCSYFRYGKGNACKSFLYCPVWLRPTRAGMARGAPNLFVDDGEPRIWLTDSSVWPLDLKATNDQKNWSKSAPLFTVVHGENSLIGLDLFTRDFVHDKTPVGRWWTNEKHNAQSVLEGYMRKRKDENSSFDDKRPVFICIGSNGYAFGSSKAAEPPKLHCTPDNYVSIMAMIIWKTADGIRISHLCGGDAHAVTEKLILSFICKNKGGKNKSPEYWPIEVMKASHHGARSSTPVDLVRAARPSKFIISAGQSHGHPSWQTVALLATYYRSEIAKRGRAARVQERPLYNLQFPYYMPFELPSKPEHLRSVDVNLNSYANARNDWKEAFKEIYGGTEEQPIYGEKKEFEEGLEQATLVPPQDLALHLWTRASVVKGIDSLFEKFDTKSLEDSQKALEDARKRLKVLPLVPTSKKEKELKKQAEAEVKTRFWKVENELGLQRAALARYMRCIWIEVSQVLDYRKNSKNIDRGLLYIRLHASSEERFDGRALAVGTPSNWTVLRQTVRRYSVARLRRLRAKLTLRPSTRKGKAKVRLLSGKGGRMEIEGEEPPQNSNSRKRKAEDLEKSMQPETNWVDEPRPTPTLKRSKRTSILTDWYENAVSLLEEQPSDIVRVGSKVLGDGSTWKSDIPDLDGLALKVMLDDMEELDFSMSAVASSLTAAKSVLKERQAQVSAQKHLQVTAGKDGPVLESIDGLVASIELLEPLNRDLPDKTFAVVDETTAGWDFLAWAGPICFKQRAQIGSELIPLGENDTTLEVLQACWKRPNLQDSYVSGIDIRCQHTAGDALLAVSLDNVRVYINRTKEQKPLTFSAQKEALNQQFELENNASARAEMTGFERLPGHLLLGLETGSHMGGFDNLGDLLDLFDVDLGIWLNALGSGVTFQLTQSSGQLPPRNGFWYLPAQDYTSVLRICGTLRLDPEASLGKLGEMIVQFLPGLTAQSSLPDLEAVFKRTAAPVFEHGNTYIDSVSEVTLWTEFGAGSPESLGLYFTLLSDMMVITVLSKGVTWSSVKEWMAKQFEDLGDALLSLEEDLAVLISNRGSNKGEDSSAVATATETAEDLVGISFHRLALTVSKDRDLLGASINFKASMPYLVQKGQQAIFELCLSWGPGLYEFNGTFIPAARGPDDPTLDGYLIDHEIWDSTIPLSPTAAPFMSLRFIDPSTEIKIPYGIPSEIIRCELYVSNKRTRISGHLASATKPPSASDASKVPILLIHRTELQIEANLDYTSGSTQASFDLSGMMTLKSSEYATDHPPCVIQAAIGYKTGAWSFSAQATDVPMISLSSLFAEGPEREGAMQMLGHVHLNDVLIDYTYAGTSVSKLKLGGSLTIAGVTTSVEYNRSENSDWKLQATVEKDIVIDVLDKKPETLGDTLGRLLGPDVAAILPDFVRDIALPDFEPDHDHVQLNCSSSAFGVVLSIGKLHVQMGQLRQDKKDKDQEVLPVKRLVIVSLGPLPSTADVPLVGSVSLPFDQLEFVWASEDFSNLELVALEAGAGFSEDTRTRIRRSPDGAPLSKGFHFRLVGDKEVWVDHPFTRGKKLAPGPGVVGQGQVIAAGQKTPPAAAGPMKTIKKKRGGLNMSGVGVSFDSDNDVLSVHLDADVAIGPISAGVQGLTVRLDLKQLGSLDKLISDASASISKVEKALTVSISGINVAFDRAPILIAGGLEHSQDEEGEMFAGDIAISLTQFSIGAYGMYQKLNAKPPFPAYNSVFVYAMVEGTLFTVGWAEIRGLVAGFGYNSMLRLPLGGGEELINYPLLKELGPDFHSNMVALRKGGWVTPSIGSLWMAAGLKIRACQTMDIRAVATLSIGPNQKDLGILARASVGLPRGVSRDKALMAIDLSIAGNLDMLHGELVVNGAIEPTSFILHHSCIPSGEFAIRSWFGSDNPHRGDWVVSFGGFHPAFLRPNHYPNPARMQINWSVSDKISVTGQGYVAVTPNALMAGGLLHAAFKSGGLEATFDAHADFLVTMAPLHYMAEMEVFAGVSYEFRKWCVTFKKSAELTAKLRLHGPPLGGTVTLHVAFFSFDVDFGAGNGSQPPMKLSLNQFEDLVRERSADRTQQNDGHVMAAISGLVSVKDKKGDTSNDRETKHWIVRGYDFMFTVRSCAPISSAKLGNDDTDLAKDHASRILSRPMQMKENETSSILSNLEARVYRGDKAGDSNQRVNFRMREPIRDRVPSNLWGPMPNDPRDLLGQSSSQTTVEHLVGFTMGMPSPETSASKLTVVTSKTQPTIVEFPIQVKSAGPAAVYLEEEEILEQRKWKRVKAVLGEEGGLRQREIVMHAFLRFFPREKETAKAFRNIGTSASIDASDEIERFYRNAPRVLYNGLDI